MNKSYTRINFQNSPSTATPLNATNLNKMDKGINDLDDRIIELAGSQEETLEEVERAIAIAKGKNQARAFNTTDEMYEWLSSNKGVAMVGDHLYIIEADAVNWWVTAVLDEPNEDGRYYEIAELDDQKIDFAAFDDLMQELEQVKSETAEQVAAIEDRTSALENRATTLEGALAASNQYNSNRREITLTEAPQTFNEDGLLYGRVSTTTNGSNAIVFVNGIPRWGVRSPDSAHHSLIWSVEIKAGDRANVSTYGSGTIDVCYFYPKK